MRKAQFAAANHSKNSPIQPIATLIASFGMFSQQVDAVVPPAPKSSDDDKKVLTPKQLINEFEALEMERAKLDDEVDKLTNRPG